MTHDQLEKYVLEFQRLFIEFQRSVNQNTFSALGHIAILYIISVSSCYLATHRNSHSTSLDNDPRNTLVTTENSAIHTAERFMELPSLTSELPSFVTCSGSCCTSGCPEAVDSEGGSFDNGAGSLDSNDESPITFHTGFNFPASLISSIFPSRSISTTIFQ